MLKRLYTLRLDEAGTRFSDSTLRIRSSVATKLTLLLRLLAAVEPFRMLNFLKVTV